MKSPISLGESARTRKMVFEYKANLAGINSRTRGLYYLYFNKSFVQELPAAQAGLRSLRNRSRNEPSQRLLTYAASWLKRLAFPTGVPFDYRGFKR